MKVILQDIMIIQRDMVNSIVIEEIYRQKLTWVTNKSMPQLVTNGLRGLAFNIIDQVETMPPKI